MKRLVFFMVLFSLNLNAFCIFDCENIDRKMSKDIRIVKRYLVGDGYKKCINSNYYQKYTDSNSIYIITIIKGKRIYGFVFNELIPSLKGDGEWVQKIPNKFKFLSLVKELNFGLKALVGTLISADGKCKTTESNNTLGIICTSSEDGIMSILNKLSGEDVLNLIAFKYGTYEPCKK